MLPDDLARSRGVLFQILWEDELEDRGFHIPYRPWDTHADKVRKKRLKKRAQRSACKSTPGGKISFIEEDEVRKAVQQCFRELDTIFRKVQEKSSASESDGRSPAMDKALRMLRHLDHDVLCQMLEDEHWFDFFLHKSSEGCSACAQTPDWACWTMEKTVNRRNATN